ncbi:terminase large subunit [Larkinella terrae]|uniref:Heat-shock protein Hsp70 n=1 Tax=Larkinella terrae TaxID=2025311 RepID=A0A7K0EDB6_9BACT|nr:terminase large subunit [Larkinella terrae]MRS59857.1 heat-shock protein Hsp70 [Larkinella terrae]
MSNYVTELQRLEIELLQLQLEEDQRTLARSSLSDFIPYLRGDKYQQQWFHLLIADKMQKVYEREIKKLMLFVPPQHGKSEISTRSFPAWVMGKNPETQLVVCSYSADLASSFNRDIQVRMDSEKYLALFPGTRLNASNLVTTARGGSIRNSAVFGIVGHEGLVRTVGVGGGITGKPVDVGIIDDPIKGRQEAQSLTTRDYVWNWYVNDFETRLHNNSVQVLIMTRWHQDDPAGRALERDGYWSEDNPFGWHVITFPALRTGDINNFDPRPIGAALWPEKHSQAKIEKVQKDNPITFNSLYQQDPKPSPDALVYPNWSTCPEFPKFLNRTVYALDFGFTNDPTALIKVGQERNRLYLDELLYKTGLNTKVLAQTLRQLRVYPSDIIVADSSEPRTISDLRQEGFTVVQAIKGPGSVNAGIDTMRSYELFVTERSRNLQTELRSYEWIMAGNVATNIPIDAFNHGLDASRYGARFLKQGGGGGIEQS